MHAATTGADSHDRETPIAHLVCIASRPRCALGGFVAVLAAATIVIVNADGAGEGFNDPTPVAPVGGNPALTLGQQRLNAFQHAASIWGATLTSIVTIKVEATFDPLTCTPTAAVLGAAGAADVRMADPTGTFLPRANTWYPHRACRQDRRR